jgi:hypothetical protein
MDKLNKFLNGEKPIENPDTINIDEISKWLFTIMDNAPTDNSEFSQDYIKGYLDAIDLFRNWSESKRKGILGYAPYWNH